MVWYQLPFESKNSAVMFQLQTLPAALYEAATVLT